MSDLIERKKAIDAIAACTVYGNADDLEEAVTQGNDWNRWSGGVLEALEAVKELPSAQHVPQWIPCSERLPDTRLVDEIGLFGEKCGEFMLSDPVLGYVCGLDDDVSMAVVWYEDDMDGVTRWTTAPDCMDVNVIAWMPLPEPYAERRADE